MIFGISPCCFILVIFAIFLAGYAGMALLLTKVKKIEIRFKGRKEGIYFDFTTRTFHNIQQSDIDGWKEAFPACAIDLEMMKMREWLLANPDKRKKNYRRFIVNWLTKGQDRGGTKKWEQEQQSEKSVGQPSSKPKTPEEEKRSTLIEKRRSKLYDKHKSDLDNADTLDKKKDIEALIATQVATYSRQLKGEG